jgi:hypothetical protein
MRDAKAVFGVSPDTIRRYELQGLQVHRVGKRISSIRVTDYEEFIIKNSEVCGAKRGAE